MGNVHLGLVRGELEAGVNAYYLEGEVATASNHTTLIDPLLIACRIDQAGPGVPGGDKRGKGQGNGLQESGKWAARWGPCSTCVFRMFKEGSLIGVFVIRVRPKEDVERVWDPKPEPKFPEIGGNDWKSVFNWKLPDKLLNFRIQ